MGSNQLFINVSPQVGIQRDGTDFDCTMYTEGSWVRFYKDRAKKIGGYQVLHPGTQEIVREMYSTNTAGAIILYLGRASSLTYLQVSLEGTTTSPIDRTPIGFTYDVNNQWSITTVCLLNDLTTYIVATAAPNALDIGNTARFPVYVGTLTGTAPLIPLTNGGDPILTAGGVMTILNFTVIYDIDSFILINNGEDFDSWEAQKPISSSKFVYGDAVRSGNESAGLLWSLDNVVKLTYTGLSTDNFPMFEQSYVSTQSTILSAKCVVNYEPFFFWIGDDCFYIYNGTVSELPNTTNKDWFFNNLNRDYKERVSAFINRRFGEIWWLFPKGESTENNHALVYVVASQTWYDTDQIDRAYGLASSSQFKYPILSSSAPEFYGESFLYPIWMHERGLNKISFGRVEAITSSFTTNINNMWLENPKATVINVDKIIPDIQQSGDILFQVNAKSYPNDSYSQSNLITLSEGTLFKDVRFKGSFFSFTFISNVIDGDYLMGKTMVLLDITDDQRPGKA